MMPVHRRHNTTSNDDSWSPSNHRVHSPSSSSVENSTTTGSLGKALPPSGLMTSRKFKTRTLQIIVLTQVVFVLWVVSQSKIRSKLHLLALLATLVFASLPAVSILAVGLGLFDSASLDLPHQRYIPLAVVATIVANQLPTVISSGMAAVGILLFGLASRPKPIPFEITSPKSSSSIIGTKSTLSEPMKAALAVILLTTVLLIDNFCVWVVAATYKPSQDMSNLPDPLQDNGQLVLRHFLGNVLRWTKGDIVQLRNSISVEWILVSGMGMSLIATELQASKIGRNLWSLSLRGLYTITMARAIRVISFVITVLPSQNPRCYFSHFPYPPPADWPTWLITGFIPQANGGCNDLIVSGHATVTSTLACVVTSVVGNRIFSAALWTLVAIDYMIEVYEGFHYSVDMWLGAVLVNLIWHSLAGVEQKSAQELQDTPVRTFYTIGEASKADWIKLSIPAMVAWIQVTGIIVPEDKANYSVVAFMIAVIYQISTSGFQHYTQHCLFCLLYIALGIYL